MSFNFSPPETDDSSEAGESPADVVTWQIEQSVDDVEALRVSTLNELVGVHLSDVGPVQRERRHTDGCD